MRKILVIARRDYMATVATKAFVIGLVLLPVLMFSGMFIPKLLKGRINTADKRIMVIDPTGELFAILAKAAEERNATEIFTQDSFEHQDEARFVLEAGPTGPITDQVRLELSERVRKEELFAFVELPADLLTAPPGPPREIPMHAQNPSVGDERRWFDKTLNRAVQAQRLRKAGIDPAIVAQSHLPIRTEGMSLFEKTSEGGIRPAEKTDRALAIFIPVGIMMLMFMAMMSSQYMLQSTLEEKQQRIAEVLLGSVSPFQLMLGKLLANVGVSLTMVGLYLLGGYCMLWYNHWAHLVPLDLFGWFLIYQVLAVVMFGSVFGAVGAACTEMKDAQNLMMPIMLVLVFPMMIWFALLKEPNSAFATGLSFIPTATPMLMILRLALSTNVPVYQPILGIVVVLAAALFCVWAGGRVYRIGILSQGKAPNLREVARWIMTG